MQLPTLHRSISSNGFSKMDISMVLNHSSVEEELEEKFDVNMEPLATSQPWKPVVAYKLPPIQTLLPTLPYEYRDCQSNSRSHQVALNSFSFGEHVHDREIPKARSISPESESTCLLPSLESLSLRLHNPRYQQRSIGHDHRQVFHCQDQMCACRGAEMRIEMDSEPSFQEPSHDDHLPPLTDVAPQWTHGLSAYQYQLEELAAGNRYRLAAARQLRRASDPHSPGSSRRDHKHSPARDGRNSHDSCRHQSSPNAIVKRGSSHRSIKIINHPHSNKPYAFEQVLFIKYMKEDCKIPYNDILVAFKKLFPGVIRDSDQCLSSRLYRANRIPLLDESFQLMFDDKGKLLTEEHKVRFRQTPEGKAKGVPITLVDSYPHLAIEFSWVSEEHKEVARQILQGNDPSDKTGKCAFWREKLRAAEPYMAKL